MYKNMNTKSFNIWGGTLYFEKMLPTTTSDFRCHPRQYTLKIKQKSSTFNLHFCNQEYIIRKIKKPKITFNIHSFDWILSAS